MAETSGRPLLTNVQARTNRNELLEAEAAERADGTSLAYSIPWCSRLRVPPTAGGGRGVLSTEGQAHAP